MSVATANWRTRPLGKLADVAAGQGAPQNNDDFDFNGTPFVRAGSLDALLNGGREEDCERVPEQTARKYGLRLFPAETILFAKSGMSAKKGRVYKLKREAYVTNHLAAIVPTGRADPNYLFRWLTAFPPTHLIPNESYPSIRLSDVERVDVPVPATEPEQRRIAAILDKADAIRARRRTALRDADALIRAVHDEALQRALLVGQVAEIPLGRACRIVSGSTLPKGEPFDRQTDGFLMLKVAELNGTDANRIVEVAREWSAGPVPAASAVPKNAIVFPKRGGAIATNKKRITGRPAVLDPNLMGVFAADERVTAPFLIDWFDRLDLATISNGSTIPQINKKDLDHLPLQVPLGEHMSAYLETRTRCDALNTRCETALADADALYASLAARAFRGEL